MERGVAVVTGASSGIGAASARALASEGFTVVLGARRVHRVAALAADLGEPARAAHLDVSDDDSVRTFCSGIEGCSLLVNCAGGALGLDRIEEAGLGRWLEMFQANVLGVARMTRALLGLP